MKFLILALLILAAVFFVLAAVKKNSKFDLTAAGLLCWLLTHLIPALVRLGCIALMLSTVGCVTYARYPNGKLALATSTNSERVFFKTPQMELRIDGHAPDKTIRAAGDTAMKAGLGGTAMMIAPGLAR